MLELLLGMSLILVVLLAIFQLFPVSDRSVNLADRTTQANLIARREMNRQLEKELDELENTTGEETISGHTHRRGQSLSTTFVYDVSVTNSVDPDVKDITVTVRWKTGAAENLRESSVRLVSSKGKLW